MAMRSRKESVMYGWAFGIALVAVVLLTLFKDKMNVATGIVVGIVLGGTAIVFLLIAIKEILTEMKKNLKK